jgi:hypothetical protein
MKPKQQRFSIWYFLIVLGSLMRSQSLSGALLHG